MKRYLPLVALAALLTGCPSYLSMTGARPASPGDVEMTGSIGGFARFGGVGLNGQALQPVSLVGVDRLNFEGMLRVGLVQDLDIGFRFGLSGLAIGGGAKYRVLNTEQFMLTLAAEIGTPLAFALISSLIPNFDGFAYWVDGSVLAGLPVDGNTLSVGAKVKVTNLGIAVIADNGTGAGVSVVSIQPGVVVVGELDVGEGTYLLPEAALHYDIDSGAVVVTVGVGGTFVM